VRRSNAREDRSTAIGLVAVLSALPTVNSIVEDYRRDRTVSVAAVGQLAAVPLVYVAWNWITVSSFSSGASFVVLVHTSERQSEKEVGMIDQSIRWQQYPAVAEEPVARAWLMWQANRNLARHTVETYGRSLDDCLRFLDREGMRPLQVTREQMAAYVRDLLGRPNPRQPKVVRIDSGAGLANATIQLRLTAVRLFFDHLVEDGVRATNPVGRGHAEDEEGGRPPLLPWCVGIARCRGFPPKINGRRSWG
jgi:hypothetical protein